MPNRSPVSEETKKKISEALKKGSSSVNVKSNIKSNSPEMDKLRNSFGAAQTDIDNARNELENMKNNTSEKSKGKKSKDQKAKEKANKDQINGKKKELIARIKTAMAKQKFLKKQAQQVKRVKKAQETIAKAQEGIKKSIALESKIKEMAAKNQASVDKKNAKQSTSKKKKSESADDIKEKTDKATDQKQSIGDRMNAALERIAKVKAAHEERQAQAESIIKSKGAVDDLSGDFSFNEDLEFIPLYERKPFVKWRKFNLLEERVNFEYLSQEFNDLEGELDSDVQKYMDEKIEKNVQKIQNKIKSGDLAAIAGFSIMKIEALAKILVNISKQAFEVGKKSASEEMDVSRYATSQKINILLNFEANETARNIINQMNTIIKHRAKEEIVKRDIEIKSLDQVTITSFINMEDVKQIAEKLRRELVGSFVGEKINQGRRFVFERNLPKLQGYQRTEYLDSRICPVCAEINGKYVRADDPFAKLDKIHTNCRGFWMPVLNSDEVDGSFGLPKKITNAFDLIGEGFPVINAFKQFKKVIS